ncbi:unnamed protein product [Camellia sinensis]
MRWIRTRFPPFHPTRGVLRSGNCVITATSSNHPLILYSPKGGHHRSIQCLKQPSLLPPPGGGAFREKKSSEAGSESEVIGYIPRVVLVVVEVGGFAMEWWHKMMFPIQRLWIVVAKRLGIRKSGLVKLRHDVRTCEYEDVHVLWDMLKRNEIESTGSKTKKRHFKQICDWSRRAPYLCCSF